MAVHVDMMQDFTMQSIIDIGLQYLNGLDIIKAERKKGKKVIGGFMPPMELGFSTETTLPAWLPRFTALPFKGIVNAITRTNKIFPQSHVVRLGRRIQGLFSGKKPPTMPINFGSFSSAFSGLNKAAERANFYRDSCVQMRMCHGAFLKYQQYVDLVVGGLDANNCLYFAKCYERVGQKRPLFYFQKPYGHEDTEHAMDLVVRELEGLFHVLEGMTGESIDFNRVKAKMRLVNEVKEIAALIFHRYFKRGYVPFQWPVSLMFHAAYTDYLSDLEFFKEKLRLLMAEIDSNIKKGLIFNYKQERIPRILFVGGPGLDPVLAQAIHEQGGCLLYIDIFPNHLRHQLIDLSGDFVRSYGRYLLGRTNFVRGIEDSMEFWLKQASMLDVEGIVFCETWACRFIAPGFRYFKDRARDELGIPVVNVAFNDLGENAGQVTTRIEAFMEMLR